MTQDLLSLAIDEMSKEFEKAFKDWNDYVHVLPEEVEFSPVTLRLMDTPEAKRLYGYLDGVIFGLTQLVKLQVKTENQYAKKS